MLDAEGSLFISDRDNHRIRKVDAEGIMSTVAGDGTWGYSGDGGAATSAWLYLHEAVTVDGDGALFISDTSNACIRKVDQDGTITTVAGTGTVAAYAGDGGPATAAELNFPLGIRVDEDGRLFIADHGNHCVRMVDANGIISTIAGQGVPGSGGDGGLAVDASLNHPLDVELDGMGTLFISDFENWQIRKVDRQGMISTVAGNGSAGDGGDEMPASVASFRGPSGLTRNLGGSLIIADPGNHIVREIHP